MSLNSLQEVPAIRYVNITQTDHTFWPKWVIRNLEQNQCGIHYLICVKLRQVIQFSYKVCSCRIVKWVRNTLWIWNDQKHKNKQCIASRIHGEITQSSNQRIYRVNFMLFIFRPLSDNYVRQHQNLEQNYYI